MLLLVRGLVGVAAAAMMLQLECVTIFSGLTGLFPAAPLFMAMVPQSGPTVLTPTIAATTKGILLEVQNYTDYDVEITFEADCQTYSASVPINACPPSTTRYLFELATPIPTSLTSVVTAANVNLYGSLWQDKITGQELWFRNGALVKFVDEGKVVHVFDPNDLGDPNIVYSFNVVERNIPASSIVIFIGTDDPNSGANNIEGRIFELKPDLTGATLSGSSLVGPTDAQGNPLPGGTSKKLTHAFVRVFPSYITAVKETDKRPGTNTVVRTFTYAPPAEGIFVWTDYRLGDTITFVVTNDSVSFIHPTYQGLP